MPRAVPIAARASLAAATLAAVSVLIGSAPRPAALARAETGFAAEPLSDRERYIEMVKRKRRADRMAAALRLEADLSAKKKTYLVLDLSVKKIYFKVRGRSLKAVSFDVAEVARSSGAVDQEDLVSRAYTLQLKEGKGVETESITLRSLTPDEAARGGAVEELDAGAEQGDVVEGGAAAGKTAGTGAPPVTQKMAGVAGGAIPPDPPARYHLSFDGNLSIWIDAQAHAPGSAVDTTLLGLAKMIGRLVARSKDGGRDEVRITIHTTLDRGRQLFRQLVCGQQMVILP